MKVYVVVKIVTHYDDYDDSIIDKIFTDKIKAENYIDRKEDVKDYDSSVTDITYQIYEKEVEK